MNHSARITVVESTPLLHDILSTTFENSSYTVERIDTASECLQDLQQDLIIVDLFLEDKDGLSLIEEIRLKNRKVPVIGFVSQAHINSLDIERQALQIMTKQSGANALFTAPINLGEAVNTINRLLGQDENNNTAVA